MPKQQAQVTEALSRKVGPLPAFVWLGLVAVVAYLYQRRKGAPAVAAVPAFPYVQTIQGYMSAGEGGQDPTGGRGRNPPGSMGERGPKPGPMPIPRDPTLDRGHRPLPPDGGVELPILGAVQLPRLPALGLFFTRSNSGGDADPGVLAGQRMTARRPALRAPLRAAQAATENAPGLVGLTALEEPPADRGRPPMPPGPALRQRPAPPRVVEDQRSVKHEVFVRG